MWQLSELPNPSPYLPQRSGYSHQLKCIRSNRIFEGGGAAYFHRAKWRPEVSSWRAKAQYLSHVSISRCWPTLIGRLGSRLPPTAVDWSVLDQIELLREGEQHYSILQSDALRWVFVVWWQPKAQCLSHVSISRRWPTLIGRLGSRLPPTAVDWSALDQIELLREG